MMKSKIDPVVVGTVEVTLVANHTARRRLWIWVAFLMAIGSETSAGLPYDVVVISPLSSGDVIYQEGPFNPEIAWQVFQDFIRQIGDIGISEFLFKKKNKWRME
jgi:hypothetical protein